MQIWPVSTLGHTWCHHPWLLVKGTREVSREGTANHAIWMQRQLFRHQQDIVLSAHRLRLSESFVNFMHFFGIVSADFQWDWTSVAGWNDKLRNSSDTKGSFRKLEAFIHSLHSYSLPYFPLRVSCLSSLSCPQFPHVMSLPSQSLSGPLRKKESPWSHSSNRPRVCLWIRKIELKKKEMTSVSSIINSNTSTTSYFPCVHMFSYVFHVFFRIISWFFIVFVENVISCHIIASLLDIHQKGFDRCLTSKPLENWLLVGRFMGFYMFLWFSSRFFRGFSAWWHEKWQCKKWIRRTGSTSAGATPCKPNTQACHFSPSFDRRSMSIHVDPFHYVSLVHNDPFTLPIFWYQGCHGLPKALVEAGEVSNSN